MKRFRVQIICLCLVLATLVGTPAAVFASCGNPNQQACSSSYGVSETFFGSGGQLCVVHTSGNSTNYCAKSSAGELGVGNVTGTSYQALAGFNTNREPSLTMIVNTTAINAGTLTPGTTTTRTATFSVEAYLAHGYVVMTNATAPQNGTYTMHTPATPSASNSSQEQFGINLVANTSPVSFGANAVCQTSGFCNLGTVSIASNYNTANKYYYPSSGVDTLLTSTSSSGQTNYTISYIFNVTNLTPGGLYTMNQDLVATGTY